MSLVLMPLLPVPLLLLVEVLALVLRRCQKTTPEGQSYQSLADLSAALLWRWQPCTALVLFCPPAARDINLGCVCVGVVGG